MSRQLSCKADYLSLITGTHDGGKESTPEHCTLHSIHTSTYLHIIEICKQTCNSTKQLKDVCVIEDFKELMKKKGAFILAHTK